MHPSAPQGNPGHPRPQYQGPGRCGWRKATLRDAACRRVSIPCKYLSSCRFGVKDSISRSPYRTRALTGMKDKHLNVLASRIKAHSCSAPRYRQGITQSRRSRRWETGSKQRHPLLKMTDGFWLGLIPKKQDSCIHFLRLNENEA